MNTRMKNAVLALFGMLSSTLFAAQPTITNVAASQRGDGSLVVDLSFDVLNSPAQECEDWNPPALSIVATDLATGSNYVASVSELSAATDEQLAAALHGSNGTHTVAWDMAGVLPAGFASDRVTFTVAYRKMPDYCVIDLSGGTNATSYAVSYLDAPPEGGWTDLYKTTKLVMRLIGPGKVGIDYSTKIITNAFYCAVFETTQRQWELVKGNRPSHFTNETYYATRPVETVSWVSICGRTTQLAYSTSFITILRSKSGLSTLDLPMEAQWEHACRAGTRTDFNNGENCTVQGDKDPAMDKVGRYRYNSRSGNRADCTPDHGTAVVGSYVPNAWGLYDMHGNVNEWCLELRNSSSEERVVRGGSWATQTYACTSSFRHSGVNQSTESSYYGFRLVRNLSSNPAAALAAEPFSGLPQAGTICAGESDPIRIGLPATFAVTVVGGSTTDSPALEGATVTVVADAPAPGMAFSAWTTDNAGVTFADADAPETTFVMPASAVTVTALFAAVPHTGDFAVESFTKYDHEASSYTVPSWVNFVVVKKASSDVVIWTKDNLTSDQLTVIESYARAHDPSIRGDNAIFISGTGDLSVNSKYGTITFAYGDEGLTIAMPNKWSHIDYGRYTEPEPEPEPPVIHVDTLCELLDFGKRFSAVIFGDLQTSGGDSEGNVLVWGNAALSPGYTVGFAVVGDKLPAAGDRDDALIVGGDLTMGGQTVNGNVVYGGDYFGPARTWAGYTLRHVAPVTIDRFGNVPADGSGRTAAELLAAVREVSTRVAAWEANGTVSVREDGSLVLSGADARRNVFSVTAEQWSGSQRDWIFDVPAGSKVVVNVDGSSVELANGRFVLPEGVSNEDVLVNYVNAASLSFASVNHAGSVLAPYASGTFTGGAIEGIAILGGDVTTSNGFEFHNFGLDVFFCPTMPEVTVTATAAGAADGDIWTAEPGTQVQVTVVVSNPSEFWLHNVKLTDSTGATIALGDIAPGGSVTTVQTLTVGDSGRFTYSATVTAAAYDTANAAAFENRPSVTASDVAVVEVAGSAGTVSEGAVGVTESDAGEGNVASASGNASVSNPYALADYAVSDMWFSCTPTFAGEQFTVNVRVVNNGDGDGNGAFLGLYLVGMEHAATIAAGEDTEAVRTIELGQISAGSSRVYSFSGLTAPDASGVCRVIAYADVDNVQREWSEGDNQNNLTYELSQVAIRIALSDNGVVLTWSNGWGQKYSILGSNDLENWDVVISDIPSARDTDGLVENEQFVGFDTGYNFFKLRIDQR